MRIHEIYRSIQGESSWAGLPCTFVRTTGCDLRCHWCDTEQAFYGGETLSIDQIIAKVNELGYDLVELTGGEPLLQKELPELAHRLLDLGATVLCETGGHRDLSGLPSEVIKIMDVKCPASGESAKNRWENLVSLGKRDEIKFVIADRNDFDFAIDVCRQHQLAERVNALLFSPVFGVCDAQALTGWLLESGVKGRVNLQLHKYIWAADTTGV